MWEKVRDPLAPCVGTMRHDRKKEGRSAKPRPIMFRLKSQIQTAGGAPVATALRFVFGFARVVFRPMPGLCAGFAVAFRRFGPCFPGAAI